jgi:thiol:disulfide interchange protein
VKYLSTNQIDTLREVKHSFRLHFKERRKEEMIEEFKFKPGFNFYRESVKYTVVQSPTELNKTYCVQIHDEANESCTEKQLTYSELVYIMFGAE